MPNYTPFELLIQDDTECMQATDDIKASISQFKLEIKNALDQLVWDLTECNKQYVDAGIADTATRLCIAANAAGVYADGSGERYWSDLNYEALYGVR